VLSFYDDDDDDEGKGESDTLNLGLQLTDFEQRVVEHLLKSPAPGKHAARSALRHLERAWKLADEMPEIAIFLAITAEEESATALFHSLKRRGYKNANHLKQKSHIYKTALHPFLLSVGKSLTELIELHQPNFFFDAELSPNGLEMLRLRIMILGSDDRPIWAIPLPPLEFSITVNGIIHNFRPELQQLAGEKNAASVQKYVENLANRRNKVLYASNQGMPGAVEVIPFLIYRKVVVFSHFIAYLLVDPHVGRQLFVQQALDSYLSMLGILSVKE
jgi:hypothetical protein